MVATYQNITKLKHAKIIANEHGCFVVEKGEPCKRVYIVYRRLHDRNTKLGARTSIDGLLKFVKKVCEV